ncbi:hypothetical protein NPIL_324791 [Nephila pilipes]|uniref:Uncharacterized protein n=1 Tax=Nephila pilipes TaxID=299642 RepID=A0A8X6P8E0_NEPPI|nr:hypothetical protein NPIL_324791 [Nephila pilipes]
MKFPNKLPSSMNSTTRPVNASTTLELSRNISTVLEQLLQNYDNRQRPDHGGFLRIDWSAFPATTIIKHILDIVRRIISMFVSTS